MGAAMEVRGRALALVLIAASMGAPSLVAGEPGGSFHCPGGTVAASQDGCPARLNRSANRTCVSGTARLCLVHDVGPQVQINEQAGCTFHDPGLRVAAAGLNVTICAEATPTPTLPPIGVDPPDDPPDGRTTVRTCDDGVGATALVRGFGARLCVEVEAGDGGDTLDVDLAPCPGGTDPRFDVAGKHVTICVRAGVFAGDSVDPDAGDVEIPRPRQLLEIESARCRHGNGARAWASGASATVCLEVETPDPGLRECEDGTGLTATSGGDEAGACAE